MTWLQALQAASDNCLRCAQALQLQAALEQAGTAARTAADGAAAALDAERAALAESRREIDVLTAAAGTEKDTAFAALKARCCRQPA